MAGKFGRRFVLVLAGLAVLTLAGPAAGLSDAEYREMMKDPDFAKADRALNEEWSRLLKEGGLSEAGIKALKAASVSAPVLSPSGKIIAAVSVSGPIERLTRQPGRLHAPAVMAAAERLSEVLRRNDTE